MCGFPQNHKYIIAHCSLTTIFFLISELVGPGFGAVMLFSIKELVKSATLYFREEY